MRQSMVKMEHDLGKLEVSLEESEDKLFQLMDNINIMDKD